MNGTLNETLIILGVLVLVLTFMAGMGAIVIVFIRHSLAKRGRSEEEIRQEYEQAWEAAKTIRLEDHSENGDPV